MTTAFQRCGGLSRSQDLSRGVRVWKSVAESLLSFPPPLKSSQALLQMQKVKVALCLLISTWSLWSRLATKGSVYQNGCPHKKLYCCFSLSLISGPAERRLEKLAEVHISVWDFSPRHFVVRHFSAHYIQAALVSKSQPTSTHQSKSSQCHEFGVDWFKVITSPFYLFTLERK